MLDIQQVAEHHQMEWYEKGQLDSYSYMLSLITYGNCVYWIDDQKYIMEKGELLLIPPGCAFYGKSIPTRVHTKQVVQFKLAPSSSMTAGRSGLYTLANELPVLDRLTPLHIKPGCYDLIHDEIKQLAVQWRDKPDYYMLMGRSLLIQLLVELNREYDRGILRQDKHRLVDMMKRHIQQHYNRKVGKEQLGEIIQRTPNYAATLFKNVTGQTISEYTHQERMKRAVYMLTESQLTIAEIAEFLGYQEVSYFYRVFKRKMGVPPAELMQERPPLR